MMNNVLFPQHSGEGTSLTPFSLLRSAWKRGQLAHRLTRRTGTGEAAGEVLPARWASHSSGVVLLLGVRARTDALLLFRTPALPLEG